MSDAYLNKHYSNFVVALLLLFPLVIDSVKIFGNLILLLLVILGIYVLVTERRSPFNIPELKLFSWITFGYFLVMLLSIIQNEGFVDDIHHLGRKAHFALAPLVALAIYRVKLPFNKLILSINIGLIIIGIIVIYQSINGVPRPSGMYNANIFGDLVLVMVFFSLINLFEGNKLGKLITVVSSSLGIYAIILSANRGTLLLLIIMSIVYLLIVFKKYFAGDTKNKLIIAAVLSTILVLLLTQNKVQSGFISAYANMIYWSENYNIITSAGLRLEMWSGSVEAVKESPWLGHGYRNANAVVSKYVDKEVQTIVFSFTHLHNEYITNLVSAGVIGLISVLALLFLPFKVFVQNFRSDPTCTFSAMGIILCVSYAGIGMTHIAFGEEHVNAFYIFFLAILLPRAIKKIKYY